MPLKQRKSRKQVTEEMKKLLRRAGSSDFMTSVRAQREMVQALQLPILQAVERGDIAGQIFDPVDLEEDASPEFPVDPVGPGQENDFTAYTASPTGRPHQRMLDGDSVTVNTVDIKNSVDIRRKYARRARWDVLTRAMKVCEAGHVYKNNTDAFSTVIASGLSRNFLVTDTSATVGVVTPKLIASGKTKFRRLGGGNTGSSRRYKLTDLFISPEGAESILGWDSTKVDDYTLRQIIISDDDTGLSRVFGIDLHTLDELGVSQEFELLFSALGGTHTNSKTQIAIGFDLLSDNTFVNPIREAMAMYEDPTVHREGRISLYTEADRGYANLDSRGCMLFQF